MTNAIDVRSVLLTSALALVTLSAACKQDKSETAADAKLSDPVFLLESGQEPKSPLRYQIAAGTTTRSIMDFGLASLTTTRDIAALDVVPGVRLHLVAGPSAKTPRGDRWNERVVESEALIPRGTPARIARDLRAGVAVLDDVGGTIERNDRGVTLQTELNERAKRPDVPAQLLIMLVNVRTTLADVPFPAEPVGLGARWETRKQMILYGFKVSQVNTYTLTDRVGDQLKLRILMQQTALPQTVSFPDDGLTLAVHSFAASGTGEILINLNALSTEARATGQSQSKVTVTTVDDVETFETERVFEFQLANTHVEIPAQNVP